MKKKGENPLFLRAKEVICTDQSVMSEGCKTLVEQDFTRLLEEYFTLSSIPKMEITCKEGVYDVCITFQAERVKKFNVLKG